MSSYWDEVERESLIQEAKETTSPERLRALSVGHLEVKAAVAKNRNTPIEVLGVLSTEIELSISLALIENEALPEALIEYIAARPNRVLQRIIAGSPRTPAAILKRLSRSDRREVLLAVAKNSQTPSEDLERLSSHRIREVFLCAQKNPKNPLYVEGNPTQRWSRGDLPQNYAALNGAPKLIIEAMTQSSDEWQRRMVIWAPTLSTEQRQRLARDEAVQIRAEVARRLSASDALFDDLAIDVSPLVRATLALNTNLDPSRRAQVASTLPPPQPPEQDPLYGLEEQLHQTFGRMTTRRQEARRVGLMTAGLGLLVLFAALFVEIPMGFIMFVTGFVLFGVLLAILAG
jgi:hypothetical protein